LSAGYSNSIPNFILFYPFNTTSSIIEIYCLNIRPKGFVTINVSQKNNYNLLERNKVSGKEEAPGPGGEKEFLDFCTDSKIGIVPLMPLASGMLTGRYRRDNLDKVQGKIILDNMQERYFKEYNFRVVEMLEEFANEKGITMPHLAAAWLLSHEQLSSVITGVTKMEHLEDNVQATNVKLSDKDLDRIERILQEARETE